ncbi:MAG: peptidylprolyl isomerase [Bacteroidetes bacterium]|uniref:Peptidyl-prolyl cis-trans isomerase n=1 Tax=Candidatus Egerieousia excrementavium TaxID=2840778 RepID=A0A9D9GXN9_9BACT|nr:peptidylprolyl isomerase [Candidatus Egerieousia excrementavium]
MRNKLLILMASLALVACKNGGDKAAKEEQGTVKEQSAAEQRKFVEEPVFDINTTMGTITVKLYSQTPQHRDNFVKLAYDKFYDGTLFHRVINGFMIQAGDPLSKDPNAVDRYGTGGPGYTIPAEINPELRHKKGALAAARKGDTANPERESSGSQFYIVQDEQTCAQLDGAYTVFGETIKGFDVIDKIAAVQVDGKDRPVTPVKILSVVEVVTPETAADSASAAAGTQQAQ